MWYILLGFALVSSIEAQTAGGCVCITGSSVNIRDGPCGNVIGSASTGACYLATGSSTVCDLSGTTYDFWEFDYSSGTGWTASDFLTEEPSTRCSGPPSSGCSAVNIVSRADWGARAPTSTTPLGTVNMQFVHHSVTAQCFTQTDCEAAVRQIQDYHMDGNGWSDIGYNFLIGEDGNAYEGRGWQTQGAHASSYNNDAIGICMIGDFTSVMPNQAALDALDNLMGCGVENNVAYPYTIHGHRDACATACPGDTLYPYVQNLPGYGGGLAPCIYDNQPIV